MKNKLQCHFTIALARLILLVLLAVPFLNACSLGKERYELTEYMGSSIKTLQRRTGVKLVENSTGVYKLENVLQVIQYQGSVTSITLLEGAKDFTLYGIKIGTSKTEAEARFVKEFGKEVSKVINTELNTVVHSYQDQKGELYVYFDIDQSLVTEISYYTREKDVAVDNTGEKTEPVSTGELILIVGNDRVYYNEAIVYLKSVQGNYEAEYGKGIWTADIIGDGVGFGDQIKEEIIKQITELKVINAKAKELGITLTEDELAEAKNYATEHLEGLSDPDIDRYLVTRDLLEQIYVENMLAEKVFETLTINVDNVVSDLEAKQITVQHILVNNKDYDAEGNPIPYTAEKIQKAVSKAQSLLEQAKTTEDFLALAESNTEAEEIEFTFGRGQGPKQYSASFEQAAFTLQTGQVSHLIATDYGWHILYCVSDFNEEATTQVKERIIEDRRNKMFSEIYTEWSAEYDVVVNTGAWSSVSFVE